MIVDANKLQYDGFTTEIMNHINISKKFESFGFYTYEVDGHDINAILSVMQTSLKNATNHPIAIIANTIKGNGISFMENQKQWHHCVLNKEQYEAALLELGR